MPPMHCEQLMAAWKNTTEWRRHWRFAVRDFTDSLELLELFNSYLVVNMSIPSFVGPLASALLFLLTVFGCCFYYCYFKPKRQRRKDAEGKRAVVNSRTGSPSFTARSCPTRAPRKYSYDEECYSGLSPYSAGYCFHGGFPISSSYYEPNWQRPSKFKGPAVVKVVNNKTGSGQGLKPKTQSGELRIDILKERCHGTVVPKHCISRQFSTESHGSSKNSCHLQVIQECEEEREENEEISEINSKTPDEGCDIVNTCKNTCPV